MYISKARAGIVLAILILCVLLIPKFRAPQLEAHLPALRKAFDAVQPITSARLVGTEERPNLGLIFLDRRYQSDSTYEEIKQNYVTQLQKNGWRFIKETKQRDMGRDLLFCKEPYAANLAFPGEKSDAGFTYGFSVSWGLYRVCNSKNPDESHSNDNPK
jgi:hypothetical protein